MKTIKLFFAINLLSITSVLVGCKLDTEQSQQSNPPNVIFLLVDDLGWTDLSCYGSSFYETPNIDRLAQKGMRFTDAYAACSVCSPTRASILTGKYPARLNITDWIPGQDPKNKKLVGTQDNHELPLKEITLAETFKSKGYNTAFLGKWHLGEQGYYPENQGFDLNKGGHWAGQPASYFYPYKNDRKRWDVPGLDGGEEGEYLTDRLTQESIQFIETNRDKPFLLYLAYYNVHTPIQAKEAYIEKYKNKLARTTMLQVNDQDELYESKSKMMQDNPTYAGMVQSVDESVGNLIDKLNALGIADNTIIVFTSDNGGLTTLPKKRTGPTSVAPLRAGKGWLYEGGIRVPTIINWPDEIKPNTICTEPIISTDFYPTLLEMAGFKPVSNQHPDGVSLVPLLKQEPNFERNALYWHFPHYHGSNNRPSAAIRAGDYKLVEWMEDGTTELYDLSKDISEQNNLRQEMPEKSEEMKELLHNWQREIGALFPKVNSDYIE